jgi:hypothetical protein
LRWYYPLSQLLEFKVAVALRQPYDRQHASIIELNKHPLARHAPSGAFFANICFHFASRQFRGHPLKGSRQGPAISVFRLPEACTRQNVRSLAAASERND